MESSDEMPEDPEVDIEDSTGIEDDDGDDENNEIDSGTCVLLQLFTMYY